MNFESALRLLAEKEPEKYQIWNRGSLGYEEFVVVGDDRVTPSVIIRLDEYFTQDDIDAILAEIGWAYELSCLNRTDLWWVWAAWTAGGAIYLEDEEAKQLESLASKSEASKAALIAVVEKVYGEQL